ncbi:MAG: hypothetical protein B7Z14_13925, partial [Bosea sp. 32-68-6]
MRADFLAQLPEEPTLAALVKEGGLYPLEPPTRTELAAIVRDPAREAGLAFEEDRQSGERLDDVILEAVAADPTALPLLEFALDQLYLRRTADGVLTFAAYRELDGVEGAIASRAEEEFAALPTAEQESFPLVFAALVNLAELRSLERPVRRRAPLADFKTSRARAFADQFVAARLFVRETDAAGAASISVAHEALFSHWTRLKGWIDTNRDLLRIRGRVELAAARWLGENHAGDLLLREGRLLAEARELMVHRNMIALAPGTVDFVEASVQAENGRKRRRLAIAACIGVGLTLAGVVSVLQWRSLAANRIEAALNDYRNALFEANRLVLSGGPRGSLDGSTLRAVEDVLPKRQAILDLGGTLPPSDAADMAKIHELVGVFQVFGGRRDRLGPALAIRDRFLEQAKATKSQSSIAAALTNPHLVTVFQLQTELAIANEQIKRQMRAEEAKRTGVQSPPTDEISSNMMEGLALIWQATSESLPT